MQYVLFALELICGVLGLIVLGMVLYLAFKFWKEG